MRGERANDLWQPRAKLFIGANRISEPLDGQANENESSDESNKERIPLIARIERELSWPKKSGLIGAAIEFACTCELRGAGAKATSAAIGA